LAATGGLTFYFFRFGLSHLYDYCVGTQGVEFRLFGTIRIFTIRFELIEDVTEQRIFRLVDSKPSSFCRGLVVGNRVSAVYVVLKRPAPVISADDIGLLLYTSGTTGVPKGAMLTHRNLVTAALICRNHFELGGASRIFGVAPLFHITGFEIQMIAAFAASAAIVLTYRFQPQVALDAFLEWKPTFIIGAITAYIALMNQPGATSHHFESFVHIYSGGAPIAPAVINAFSEKFGRKIRTSYGMTELTSASHLAPNEGRIPVDSKTGALSIGKPTPNADAIVLDDERNPLGPREHGEVVVRGPGVMTGYWGKPAETDEVLTNGWLHTGDVGFFDEDGWFYLVDRKKDMISASGFKVWPREVEDVIYAFPGGGARRRSSALTTRIAARRLWPLFQLNPASRSTSPSSHAFVASDWRPANVPLIFVCLIICQRRNPGRSPETRSERGKSAGRDNREE